MADKLPRVAVLMGGPDEEHDISIETGSAVLAGLKEKGHEATAVRIERDGSWSFAGGDPCSTGSALDRLRAEHDVTFVAMHGRTGEGGIVQGALELAGIPFTGSDSRSSAAAMDKRTSRALFRQARLPVAAARFVAPDSRRGPRGEAEGIVSELGLPVFAKPTDSGSSYGVTLVEDTGGLLAAVEKAFDDGTTLIVEAKVEGPEYTTAVLERGGPAEALPPILIRPKKGARFFTLDVKYDPDAVDEICPAPVPEDVLEPLRALGLKAHRALGCRDISRTDIMWGETGPVLLETNTIPGLTPASLFPKAATAAGISFAELVSGLARRAFSRK
jgi:D-alanine-D-alanine ligase